MTGPFEAPGVTFGGRDTYFLNDTRAVPPAMNLGRMALLLPRPTGAGSDGFRELAWDFRSSAAFAVADEVKEDDMLYPGGRNDLSAQSVVV